MTQASEGSLDARKLAAIVAAVQAFLDGEEQAGRRGVVGISAWRRNESFASDNAFVAHHRSWTGRD